MGTGSEHFDVVLTVEAVGDLRLFEKPFRQPIMREIEEQLLHEPMQETRSRKRLRPNHLAEWELRVGEFRVFYDVLADSQEVKVSAVGRKAGNRLFVRGKESTL